MWWTKKEVPVAAVEPTAVALTEPAPAAELVPAVIEKVLEPEIPPFGTQAHGLTRFGNTWLNLSEMTVLEFDPPDGCGAECMFKSNGGQDWHIPDADARALRAYLEGFESVQKAVDDAAQAQTTPGS